MSSEGFRSSDRWACGRLSSWSKVTDKVQVLHEKRLPLPQDAGNINVRGVHTKQAASVQSDAQNIKTSATLGDFILNKSLLKNKILQTLIRRVLFQVKGLIFLLQSTHLKDIPAVKKHSWPLYPPGLDEIPPPAWSEQLTAVIKSLNSRLRSTEPSQIDFHPAHFGLEHRIMIFCPSNYKAQHLIRLPSGGGITRAARH